MQILLSSCHPTGGYQTMCAWLSFSVVSSFIIVKGVWNLSKLHLIYTSGVSGQVTMSTRKLNSLMRHRIKHSSRIINVSHKLLRCLIWTNVVDWPTGRTRIPRVHNWTHNQTTNGPSQPGPPHAPLDFRLNRQERQKSAEVSRWTDNTPGQVVPCSIRLPHVCLPLIHPSVHPPNRTSISLCRRRVTELRLGEEAPVKIASLSGLGQPPPVPIIHQAGSHLDNCWPSLQPDWTARKRGYTGVEEIRWTTSLSAFL